MLARMLEFGLVLLWTLGFITYSSAINVQVGQPKQGILCLSVSSITKSFDPVTACAPAFGKFKDVVSLAKLGLENEDKAGYGFGFNVQNILSELVVPYYYVELSWRSEYKFASYEDDGCFHNNLGIWNQLATFNAAMKNIDGEDMCLDKFREQKIVRYCLNDIGKGSCPRVPNPFYIAKSNKMASLQETGSSDQTSMPGESRPGEVAADPDPNNNEEINNGIDAGKSLTVSDATINNAEIPSTELSALTPPSQDSITQDQEGTDAVDHSLFSSSSPSKRKRNTQGLRKRFRGVK